ncbi:hypothetical protein [Halorussus salinisoli]|nr:hypothetical protein [Halorussus salinisoli]
MATTDDDEQGIVRAEYIYTGGSKRLADLKLRVGEWLEERRGW